MLPEDADEEVAFGFRSRLPVDQAVPPVGEILDVFLLIVIRFTNRLRRIAKMLMVRISGRELVLR